MERISEFMIEALSQKETDCIQSVDEAFEMVQRVDSPHYGLHLDLKAIIDADDDLADIINKYGKNIKHIHVGDPGLAPPGSTGFDHKQFGDILKTVYLIKSECKIGQYGRLYLTDTMRPMLPTM